MADDPDKIATRKAKEDGARRRAAGVRVTEDIAIRKAAEVKAAAAVRRKKKSCQPREVT